MSIRAKIITKNGFEEVDLTPIRAIRKKCLECCCWSEHEVELCPADDCALYVFRKGKTGNKRVLSDEQRGEMATRMKAMRKLKELRQ